MFTKLLFVLLKFFLFLSIKVFMFSFASVGGCFGVSFVGKGWRGRFGVVVPLESARFRLLLELLCCE